jgi:hypothetical protein
MAGTLYDLPGCCGAGEFFGINSGTTFSPKNFIETFKSHSGYYHGDVACHVRKGILLIIDRGYGSNYKPQRLQEFKKFIESNNLGTVTIAVEAGPNPTHGGRSYLWGGVWVVNQKGLREYFVPPNKITKLKRGTKEFKSAMARYAADIRWGNKPKKPVVDDEPDWNIGA